MVKRLKRILKKIKISRTTVIAVVFCVFAAVLLRRLYVLQIINGQTYRDNFEVQTTKARTLKATRGNIYDRNGNLIAGNRLSYSLTLEDSGTYESSRIRALSLNGEAYRISKLLKSHGDSLSNDYHVVLDENGNYAYDVSGRTLLRFRADVFGHALTDDLTDMEAECSAEEMIDYFASSDTSGGFAIIRTTKPYTDEELEKYGLPKELTKQEILDIIYVRYQLFTTSYRKYLPVTIATDLSDESVADLIENAGTLTGIDVVEDSVRVYDQPEAFASMIGYIGKISTDELSEFSELSDNYTTTSIVGKSGIEKIFETTLQGTDGEETVNVNNVGKVLNIDESATVEPVSGNDVYLTIDKNLQVAAYNMLEQRIAGILESMIINAMEFDYSKITDTYDIRIPIGDVYNALIENQVIDISHFQEKDASDMERSVQALFDAKIESVIGAITSDLKSKGAPAHSLLDEEIKEYEDYLVNTFLTSSKGILETSEIDKNDEVYKAYTNEGSISLREYLIHAAEQNWIDAKALGVSGEYLDSTEIYESLITYIEENLPSDKDFSAMLYKNMIISEELSGAMLVQILYDQGVFDTADGYYDTFTAGSMDAYALVLNQIHNLVLTPADLALEPCSGSAVITDPNTGEVLACVTYPGYDNNRLANTMDVEYYNKLAQSGSRPFYNKATQQTTAPGSTFKLVTTTAGLEEGVISRSTTFNCTGVFDLTDTPLNCWLTTGHGSLDIVGGIANSCNVFFSNVAYQLGTRGGTWSDSRALKSLQTYAQMYNLDENSGIELPEAAPSVSDQYAIASSIGQGTHAYTTTQLTRYVTTLANGGTSYSLSIVDKVCTPSGTLIEDYSPEVKSLLSVSGTTWDTIHEGMRSMIVLNHNFDDFPFAVSGKTGTAQVSKTHASHALFMCYAPSENPTISLVVRIGNGYASTNALLAGKDILQYYFNLADESELITGTARTDSVTTQQVD